MNDTQNVNASKEPEDPSTAKQDAAVEQKFINRYAELTGASEAQARCVFMYFDIIQQRDPEASGRGPSSRQELAP
jgi:hypothetical protein